MSIPGLTDKSASFKEIGRLRKGAPKSKGLVNLKYFRPDFRPDEMEAARRFSDVYGTTPNRINIRLAFPAVELVWGAWFTVYNTAGMLGKAGGIPGREGWWWIYLRDNKSGKIIVKDGFPEMKFDPTIPVYSYYSQKKQCDIPVYAKPEGKLKVLVPELRMVNYMTVLTHGWYDINRISEQLAGVADIAARVGQTLPMVPLVLTRRPEQVSCSIDGKKSMREEWIINIDIREDWAASQFQLLDTIQPGMLLPAPKPPAELPAGVRSDESESEAESEEDYGDYGQFQEEEQSWAENGQSTEPVKAQPAATETPVQARPYAPETLKGGLEKKARAYPKFTPNRDQQNLLRHGLELAFAGVYDGKELDEARHAVLLYLTGKPSTKDITGQMFKAIVEDWLKMVQDKPTGEYSIEPFAAREAIAIAAANMSQALKAEGQAELPL